MTTFRLLVVDDDDAIQLLMRAIFRRHGFALDGAADGRAAIERLRRTRYDAVLLDLMLPLTNGFEVIRELKSCAPGLLSRTIVLTAASDFTLRDFNDGILVRRVMRKPFDLADLVDEVLACVIPVEHEDEHPLLEQRG